MTSALERFRTIFASAKAEHNGKVVDVSVDNGTEMVEWEYHCEGKIASVRVSQPGRDEIGDPAGPVEWALAIELEPVYGQWAWEVCHVYALDYVTTGVIPVWHTS